MIDCLARRGADVNACDRSLLTPLHHAATNGFCLAAERLIVWGAKVNAPGPNRCTPLDVSVTDEMDDLLQRYGGLSGRAMPVPPDGGAGASPKAGAA